MAKTSEKIRYILGWLAEASIERQDILGEIRKLYAKVQSMSDVQTQVKMILDSMRATMENQTTVIGSFKAFMEAHDAALTAAIQAQLDAGASADVLAPLQELQAGYKANTDALTASLVTRTPADPTTTAPATSTAPAVLLPQADASEPAAPVTAEGDPAGNQVDAAPTADQPAQTSLFGANNGTNS